MKFYIVTPTFNSLTWLQNCIRSVADQGTEHIQVHHHIQDGGSTDGTVAWLEEWAREQGKIPHYSFSYVSGKDAGMYDAINRAWDAIPDDADITAHLNSDEQYLPNTFVELAAQFQQHPRAEVALGSYFILDAKSRYICHRRPVRPRAWRGPIVCEIITCSCFYRVDYFKSIHLRFDTSMRALADMIFYQHLTALKPRYLMLPKLFSSCFVVTGNNLAWSETSKKEWRQHMESLPSWQASLHPFAYRWSNLLRRLVNRIHEAPKDYSIYLYDSSERTRRTIMNPTAIWACRTEGEAP